MPASGEEPIVPVGDLKHDEDQSGRQILAEKREEDSESSDK